MAIASNNGGAAISNGMAWTSDNGIEMNEGEIPAIEIYQHGVIVKENIWQYEMKIMLITVDIRTAY